MVAGDLVNTASRVQSAADPGRCSSASRRGARPSRRSSTRTPARYELKGKAGLDSALAGAARRLRAAAARSSRRARGAVRRAATASCGTIKELFHALRRREAGRTSSPSSASPGSASRASRGSSTSTSTGIAETIYWHRGRCLSYGEGVTYWALADMVRMRCRIAEDEEPASAQAKLHATLEEHILDA